jgi:hypothetical protein
VCVSDIHDLSYEATQKDDVDTGAGNSDGGGEVGISENSQVARLFAPLFSDYI